MTNRACRSHLSALTVPLGLRRLLARYHYVAVFGCMHLHSSACWQYFFLKACNSVYSGTLCAPSACPQHYTCLKLAHICVSISMCVWSMGCNSLWLQPRPLAGKAVGLAGLNRALKLCSSAWLGWWLRARLHVRLKRYSRELTERPPAWKQDSVIMSYYWQPY